jgi:integrin beta 3
MDNPDAIVVALTDAVRAALAPVVARVAALESAAAVGPPVGDVGPTGPPGPPGADGAGVDGFNVAYDGERRIALTWTQGGARVERAIVVPLMIHKGVYLPDRLYERGDCVTVGGSVYHCNLDTTTRPGAGGAAWTLIVKGAHPGGGR